MNKALWSKKALAVPACAAIMIGGLTLAATPANADPADLSVTSSSVSGRTLTVTGHGTPSDYIQLSEDFRNTRETIPASGDWTITYTIPGTDTASRTYTVQQLLPNGLNDDGSTTVTAAPQAEAPAFAITSHTVSGRTVTVSGTGNPDNTVQIDPQSAPIVRHQIADDGTWSFTFDIPGTDTDSHEYTVLEENNNFQIQAQGSFTAAAQATQADFSVTSPKNGDKVGSRTVTFTGTGQEGDQINVLDTDGNRLGGFNNFVRVGADQTWTLTVPFAADAAQQQTVRVTDVRGASGAGDVTLSITLPAAQTDSALTLITPKDGSTVGSRTVTYTGTGTPGDAVGVSTADGETLVAPATVVGEDGTWTTTGTFSDSAAVQQDLVVTEVDPSDLSVVDTIDFSITLPAVATTPGTTPGTTPAGTAPVGTAPASTLPVVAG